MEVILLDKITHLGALGDTVKVKGGYARNYLLPQKKAVMATKENLEKFKEQRAELEARIAASLAAAQDRAAKLQAVESYEIEALAGDEGKLFGSVGTRDIAEVLSKSGVTVTKSEVRLPDGVLRNVGEYDITVRSAQAANYDITYVAGKLTVTEANPVTVTAKSYSRYYGEANPTLEYEVDGAALNGEPTLSCSATEKSPVGTYPITITKGGVKNYNDAYVEGVLTILPAPLTITANDATKVYGAANPTLSVSYSGFVNDDDATKLTTQPTVTTTATTSSAAGKKIKRPKPNMTRAPATIQTSLRKWLP